MTLRKTHNTYWTEPASPGSLFTAPHNSLNHYLIFLNDVTEECFPTEVDPALVGHILIIFYWLVLTCRVSFLKRYYYVVFVAVCYVQEARLHTHTHKQKTSSSQHGIGWQQFPNNFYPALVGLIPHLTETGTLPSPVLYNPNLACHYSFPLYRRWPVNSCF